MFINEFPVTLDDFLWAFLWAGFLMTFAYVRSELVEHQTRRARESERLAQRQSLFPSTTQPRKAVNSNRGEADRGGIVPAVTPEKRRSCMG
jgi:hypothetical protein